MPSEYHTVAGTPLVEPPILKIRHFRWVDLL
jgi:hypothetical protein